MRLKDIPKYTTTDVVMKLTKKQRQVLYQQCKSGRSCYLVDANFNQGSFYEDVFNEKGEL